MTRKILLFATAAVVPGGFVMLFLGWLSQRPEVKNRLRIVWGRISGRGHAVLVPVPTLALARIPFAHRVPVAASRCFSTTMFAPVRLAA